MRVLKQMIPLDEFPSPQELWQRYRRFDPSAINQHHADFAPAIAAEPLGRDYKATNVDSLILQSYQDDGNGKSHATIRFKPLIAS